MSVSEQNSSLLVPLFMFLLNSTYSLQTSKQDSRSPIHTETKQSNRTPTSSEVSLPLSSSLLSLLSSFVVDLGFDALILHLF